MDLLVHENDLIVATQGRALWILDDLTPLHQIDEGGIPVATVKDLHQRKRQSQQPTATDQEGQVKAKDIEPTDFSPKLTSEKP